MTVVLLALGTFALVNLVKFLSPYDLTPLAKVLVALLVSAGAAVLAATDVQQVVLYGGGAFGLSALLHAIHKLLDAAGDEKRLDAVARLQR